MLVVFRVVADGADDDVDDGKGAEDRDQAAEEDGLQASSARDQDRGDRQKSRSSRLIIADGSERMPRYRRSMPPRRLTVSQPLTESTLSTMATSWRPGPQSTTSRSPSRGLDRVAVDAAEQAVLARAADEHVAAAVAPQGVVAGPALELVAALAAAEAVVAAEAGEPVVAGQAEQAIAAGGSAHLVGAAVAG